MTETAETIQETSVESTQVRSVKLDTLVSVRREMTEVYFKAKKKVGKDITVAEAGRLVYILDRIRSCISEGEIERRVSILEQQRAIERDDHQ